jgi:tetratricopeptide (TPR) repeat protein
MWQGRASAIQEQRLRQNTWPKLRRDVSSAPVNEERSANSNDSNRRPPEGEAVELTVKEAERLLLTQLQDKNKGRKTALKQLASLYGDTLRYDQALGCLRELMALETDLDQKAACVLAMGANAEKQQDFGAAVRFYREALAMESMRNDVWYFIHNNLGFSLNTLGHFAEGEQYCRNAIEIDPTRCNAHKNLGFALAGQRQHRKAAGCFVTAAQVNAADARSLRLLLEMLREQPELECEFQGDVECCKKAVELAAQKASELKPVYRGWRKHLILWQAKLRSVGQKLRNLFHSS